MMIRKKPGALLLESARESGLEFLGGKGIEAWHARGEIDQAGLIRLAHKVHEPPGGVEGMGCDHDDVVGNAGLACKRAICPGIQKPLIAWKNLSRPP